MQITPLAPKVVAAAANRPIAPTASAGTDLCMRATRTFSSIAAAQQAAEMAAWTYGVDVGRVNVEPNGNDYLASVRFCDDGVFAEASLKSAVAFFNSY